MALDVRAGSRRRSLGLRFSTTTLAIAAGLAVHGSALGQITWDVNGNGIWQDDANWDTGTQPNAPTDNVVILNPVSSATAVVVTVGPNITRDVGTLTINDTGVAAKHELVVANNTFFEISGNVTNNGTISVVSTGNATRFRTQASFTLDGTGTLRLVDNGTGLAIIDNVSTASDITQLAGHTIAGSGNLGGNTAGIINGGLIDADVDGATLTVDPRNVVGLTNTGTLRASNGGILLLTGVNGGDFDSTGGNIGAFGVGSEVQLTGGADVTGGVFTTDADGLINVLDSAGVSFIGSTFAVNSNVRIGNNADAVYSGTISHQGTTTLDSAVNNADFRIGGDVMLTGGGTIVMASSAGGVSTINDAGGVQNILTNVNNTIRGQGNLGGNSIGFVNQALGLVSADVSGATLVFDPGVTHGASNAGTMQAVNGAMLLITGANGGDLDNTGGNLDADGVGSRIELTNGIDITNGNLRGLNGGTIETLVSQTVGLIDVDVTGTHNVANNADLVVTGTYTNNGTTNLNPDANNTDFRINGDVILDGGGTLAMNAGTGGLAILNDAGGGQNILTNVNNTIRGTGNLGQNTLGLVNQVGGLVLADLAGQDLTIDPGVTNGLTNEGTFRATNGASLTLTGANGGTFANTGGTIETVGAGNEVRLTANVSLTGGDLIASAGSSIESIGGQTVNLIDVDVTGTHNVGNNTDLIVTGTYTNNGTTNLNPDASNTDFRINGDVTLDGGGTLAMNASAGAGVAILNDAGGVQNVLTNVDNTIRGTGNLGQNTLGLVNQAGGLVLADLAGQDLTVDPGTTNGLTNEGTFRATNGASLTLTGNGNGTFANAGGTIETVGAGNEIRLTANVNLTGGDLIASAGSSIESLASQTVNLIDVNVAGTHNVGNNTDLVLTGTYTNAGTTTLNPDTTNSDLRINGDVTLNGGGTLLLNPTTGTGGTSIVNDGGGVQNRLTNVDNTIRGSGNLGQNSISLTNRAGGTVLADGGANGLTINPGVTLVGGETQFLNEGLVRATNNTTLSLSGTGGGAFENAAGGTIDIDAGSTLELSGTLTHRQGAVIDQAGVFNVNSGGNFINEADDYSPGASPGIVNVNSGGTFTNDASGTVTFELDGDTTPGVDFDTIRGDGTFNLAGTIDLELGFTPDFYESIELILDTSSSNVNGTFDQLAFDPITAPGDALAVTYEANAVLLTRAIPGDANLDGFIGQADLNAVLLNFGSTDATWQTGEFTGDDFVGQADLNLVLLGFGSGTPPVTAVPEPTTLTLGVLSTLALVGRRRTAR
ncbi:MAG: hypothetical protein AAF333_03810 [Planctomycetota bacterium]